MQKLHIARALFYKRPINIFDEPTSAIDPESGFKIIENIFKTLKKQTTILISHRYSMIKDADLIIVLNNGKIIEKGTHKSLMQQNGYYAKAFKHELKKMQT